MSRASMGIQEGESLAKQDVVEHEEYDWEGNTYE